jgi:hypothetical protein
VVIARETNNVAVMSDDNIREGYMLWMKRAGEGWCSLGMAILNIYWKEYIRRGLNK